MIQDKGSNYSFFDHTEKANPSRSVFDLSFLNSLTINNAGLIIPIALFETLPYDDFDINISALLRVLPQVVTLYSRQRLFIHAYYSRLGELWCDAETFMTKGYNGNTNIVRPGISLTNFDTSVCGVDGSETVKPESLADYFGLPQGVTYASLFAAGVSALPFMMYERVYRDYYMNKNYYIENRQWLPNDDGELRLNSDGEIICVKNNPTIPQGDSKITFGKLHYRDWTQDYFTSAVPFAQRGESASFGIGGTVPVLAGGQEVYFRRNGNSLDFGNRDPSVNKGYEITGSDGSGSVNFYQDNIAAGNVSKFTVDLSSVSAITVEQLRTALIAQSEMETMARTDGSYAEFGLAFFGKVSKVAHSYKPTYIGGTYQPLVFTEVVQTSATTTDVGSSSPLGAQAGHGISASSGNIGHISCDDYGYIMIVASIMPDTYYCQGLHRMWTRLTQDDMYLPDRAKLGMQAIKNQELYFTGTLATDRDIFAYQGRADEFRYMENSIHGKIADKNNSSFFPYTQARIFESVPGYSQEFAVADDVRKDYLFSQVESAYTAQFAVSVRAVRPLPYKAIPAQII